MLIPASCEYGWVTEIGEGAFRGDKDIVSVVIPDSVGRISDEAFMDCASLETVKTGKYGPRTLGKRAFCGCVNLKKMVVSETLKKIEEDAFKGCAALKVVSAYDVAAWCDVDFENIESNPLHAGGTFCLCSESRPKTSLTIPASVLFVKKRAFMNCSSLKNVTFSDGGVGVYIGEQAFKGCGSLKKVMFSVGVAEISREAFEGCASLTEMRMPSDCRCAVMGERAFSGCENLEKIVIARNVDIIENHAFYGCSGLRRVIFDAENARDLQKDNGVFLDSGTDVKDGIEVEIGVDVISVPAYMFCPQDDGKDGAAFKIKKPLFAQCCFFSLFF